MDEQLYRSYSDSQFKGKHHPGCMWGILHVLDFHNWHTVKKILPYKRNGGGRNGDTKNTGTTEDLHDTGEAQELMESEVEKLLGDQKLSGSSPSKKKSAKRLKKIIAEQMSKEESHKHKASAFPSRLLRTDSIHHLESSHHNLPDEVRTDDDSASIDLHEDDSTASTSRSNSLPMKIPFHNQCEVCSAISTVKNLGSIQLAELRKQLIENGTLLQDSSKETLFRRKSVGNEEHKDIEFYQQREVMDALEIFNVKRELFLTILQDPDYALAHHFQGLWSSNAKRGLTKSGSFPVPNVNIKPIKLKYKQNENEEVDQKVEVENPPSALATDNCSENNQDQTMSLKAESNADIVQHSDEGSSEVRESKPVLDSGSSLELKKRARRFKDIKHKIKLAIRESRKEGHRISMDAILHKIPYGRRFSKNAKRETSARWKESTNDADGKDRETNSYGIDSSVYTPGEGSSRRMKRTPSLNESLDRYSQLFESTSNGEAKSNLSVRRKLPNEDGIPSVGRGPKYLGRILSLPDLESYYCLQNEVSQRSGKSIGILVKSGGNDGNISSDEKKSLGLRIGLAKRGSQENLVGVDESSLLLKYDETSVSDKDEVVLDANRNETSKLDEIERSEDLDMTMAECSSNSHDEQEFDLSNNASSKIAQPSPLSVLDYSSPLESSSPAVLSNLAETGQELKPREIQFDELDCSGEPQDWPIIDSAIVVGSTQLIEGEKEPSMGFESGYLQFEVDRNEAEFIYVSEVLKLSGFIGNECLGTWHSVNQPVDPSLFEELENTTSYKPDCPEGSEAEGGDRCDHQLLFDMINEVLLEIYERSFTYWPLPLSRNSSIRPMPIGYHVLEEVWASISWYLSEPPIHDPSLDFVMARDLAKSDGWMNLQVDMECVALELEEVILDDLLEEIIDTCCSCDPF